MDLIQAQIAQRLRRLADFFQDEAERDESQRFEQTVLDRRVDRMHEAGVLMIAAHRRGLLNLPGLGEVVCFHAGERETHPDPPLPEWEAGQMNLFHEVIGSISNDFSKDGTFEEKLEVTQRWRIRGILPNQYPELFPLNPYYCNARPGDELQKILDAKDADEFVLQANALRLLADLVERADADDPSDEVAGVAVQELITLDQAAAMVNRKKQALQKRKGKGLPPPDVKGRPGQPDEWRWDTIRPWLEAEFNRKLPDEYPSKAR